MKVSNSCQRSVIWSDLSSTYCSLIGWPLFGPIQSTTFKKGEDKKGEGEMCSTSSYLNNVYLLGMGRGMPS